MEYIAHERFSNEKSKKFSFMSVYSEHCFSNATEEQPHTAQIFQFPKKNDPYKK